MSFKLANLAGQAVLLDGQDYWALGTDPMDAITRLQVLHDRWASRGGPDGQASLAELGPPVPAPKQVFGYGLNYRDHIEELDREDPLGSAASEAPVVFTKFPTCLVGPAAPVEVVGDHCDYECELVVVIGTETSNVDENQAWDRVAGLMIGQDISDREPAIGGDTGPVQPGQVQDLIRPHRPCIGKRRLGGQSRRSGDLL